ARTRVVGVAEPGLAERGLVTPRPAPPQRGRPRSPLGPPRAHLAEPELASPGPSHLRTTPNSAMWWLKGAIPTTSQSSGHDPEAPGAPRHRGHRRGARGMRHDPGHRGTGARGMTRRTGHGGTRHDPGDRAPGHGAPRGAGQAAQGPVAT